MSGSTEHIVARVRALLEKSRARGATEAEAQSAAQAAERILARHCLSMADVEASPVSGVETGLRYLDPWIRNMAIHAARYYGCEPLITQARVRSVSRKTGQPMWSHYRTITLFGRPAATGVAVSMIQYLYDTVIRMSREHSSLRKNQMEFQRGAGERIASRLWDMRESQRQAAASGPADGTSLIVVEQSEARSWMEENLELVKMRLGSSSLGSSSSSVGWHAGGEVNLGGQVGSSSAGATRLGR